MMAGPQLEKRYSPDFYRDIRDGSLRSAKRVLEVVRDLIGPEPVASIVDVGCGDGSWLVAAGEVFSSPEILGIDGRHVLAGVAMRIPTDRFIPHDIGSDPATLPLLAGHPRDLCLCLEVAEHLPASSADQLVEALCNLAPVVLFSAAIPHQGGTLHVNEQWPQYWIEKFQLRGCDPVDAIRPRVWNDSAVEFWYKQNTILFVSHAGVRRRPSLRRWVEETSVRGVPSLVHPDLFLREAQSRSALQQSRVLRFMSFIRNAFSRLMAAVRR